MSKENKISDKQQKGNDFIADVMWRSSSVILIPIVFFVLLVVRPIKWIITGYYYPKDPQKVKTTWLYKWILKTGLGWFR